MPAWPSGELYFNPLAWQVLFVFGAWYAYEGAGRLRTIVQSRAVLVLAILYLAFSLAVTLSWQIKALEGFMPDAVSKLIYPIYKSHLAPLRLLHFLALAILVSRLTPPDWHGLMKLWMMAAPWARLGSALTQDTKSSFNVPFSGKPPRLCRSLAPPTLGPLSSFLNSALMGVSPGL